MRLFNPKLIILLLLVVFSNHLHAATKEKSIRILNWWDYLDKRILQKLDKHGIPSEVIEYRSNDVAMSKIASSAHDFDIAIISNVNRLSAEKAELVKPAILSDLFNLRASEYDRRVVESGSCIPYMWSSSVFSYDSRTIKNAPTTIEELISLKKDKIRVGVIDDPYEVALRVLLDTKGCESDHPLIDCVSNLSKAPGLSPEDFISSIEQIILQGQFAAYGWHGIPAMHMVLDKYKWIKAVPAARHPVVGIDYVCILKRKRTKERLREIVRAVQLLTERESIRWNVEKTQYFSPYKDDIVGLHPRVIELYKIIMANYEKSFPVQVYPPNQKSLKIINSWWKNVRYTK